MPSSSSSSSTGLCKRASSADTRGACFVATLRVGDNDAAGQSEYLIGVGEAGANAREGQFVWDARANPPGVSTPMDSFQVAVDLTVPPGGGPNHPVRFSIGKAPSFRSRT